MTNYLLEKFGNFELYLNPIEQVQGENGSIVSKNLNWYNLSYKRLIDLSGVAVFILLFGWWLFPLIALLIKLDSKGPVFFKQPREGINNTTFNCYKFRSMVVNQEAHLKQATKNDPRITKVGRILRKTSIDELPQLLNVLYGNMSLVGPRPHIPVQNESYSQEIEGYRNRHLVKPGLTGLAQARGYRGETQMPNMMYFRYRLDMYYIKNWHPMFDIKIMLMTIKSILTDNSNAH